MNCDYCRRPLSASETCKGCGAPNHWYTMQMLISRTIINPEYVDFKGRPGALIPIRDVREDIPLSHLIQLT